MQMGEVGEAVVIGSKETMDTYSRGKGSHPKPGGWGGGAATKGKSDNLTIYVLKDKSNNLTIYVHEE